MPIPALLPHQSPTQWERKLHDYVDSMATSTAVVIGLLGLALAVVLDIVIDVSLAYDFIEPAVYMLPVGFMAWACGFRFGFLFTIMASALELVVCTSFIGPREPRILGVHLVLLFSSLVVGSYLTSRLRYLLEEEKSLARTDPLTKINNSRSFWAAIELEIARMKREEKPLTILFADVDNFKTINDTLGHKCGDRILTGVGHALSDVTRAIDSVARIGGDEFAALLPGADSSAGLAVAERLRAALEVQGRGYEIAPTLSIGLATFLNAPDDTESLLQAADLLMYEAKTAGKDRVAVRTY